MKKKVFVDANISYAITETNRANKQNVFLSFSTNNFIVMEG